MSGTKTTLKHGPKAMIDRNRSTAGPTAGVFPGCWLSVYDLAAAMSRTPRWVRKWVRDEGNVPCAAIGDTEFFATDDVILWLEGLKKPR